MLKACTTVLILATLATVGTCLLDPTEEQELKCMTDNNISREELNDEFPLLINNGDTPVDQKYKNYAKCLMELIGLKKDDGTFDLKKFAEVGKTKERRELVITIGSNCMAAYESIKTDEPEYAFSVMNCIIVNIQKELRKQEENEA